MTSPFINPSRWTAGMIAKVVVGIIVIIAAFLSVRACQNNRSLGEQVKIDAGQIGAFKGSASDASQTQANVATNDMASGELDRSNEKDIRDAQGSNAAVAQPTSDAGLRALCKREAYRRSERCRVFQSR